MSRLKEKEAQRWLNDKYPEDGDCKIEEGGNRGERRRNIVKLDISKKTLKRLEIVLTGSLELKGFAELKTLICSSHQLTSLNISECSKLEKLICDDNKLTSLDIKTLNKLIEINCSNNEIVEIDLSSNIELKELYCHNNSLTKIIGLEKLRGSLVNVNSGTFSFLSDELGKNIDDAKKYLENYKELMNTKNNSYQKIIDSNVELFREGEKEESKKIKENYKEHIKMVEVLTDKKWK